MKYFPCSPLFGFVGGVFCFVLCGVFKLFLARVFSFHSNFPRPVGCVSPGSALLLWAGLVPGDSAAGPGDAAAGTLPGIAGFCTAPAMSLFHLLPCVPHPLVPSHMPRVALFLH